MNKNLRLMYTAGFLQGLVFYAPISLIYRMERGLELSQFFFLEFLLMLIIMGGEVPWGYFADRFGYKKTLVISHTIILVSKIGLLLSNSFSDFFIQTVIHGIGISGISGCDIAYIHGFIGDENSEKVFGKYHYYNTLAMIIAAITSYFFINISLEAPLMATIGCNILVVAVVLLTKDNGYYKQDSNINSKQKLDIKGSFKNFSQIKLIFIFIISTALISEVSYAVGFSLGQVHYENIGIDIAYFGYIVALSNIIALFARKSYILSNKFGQERALSGLMIISAICVFGLIFTEDKIISVILTSMAWGLTCISFPIITDIQNKTITKNRATILSVYSMIGSLSSGIINIFIGFSADINIKYAFMICFIIMTISIIGVTIYNKNNNEELNYNEES